MAAGFRSEEVFAAGINRVAPEGRHRARSEDKYRAVDALSLRGFQQADRAFAEKRPPSGPFKGR
jgi:hypothetical protein